MSADHDGERKAWAHARQQLENDLAATTDSQRVTCLYCGHMMLPRDPYHVHGHNECLCGVKPRHNDYFHEAPPVIATEDQEKKE
jgi:hypothetical protein